MSWVKCAPYHTTTSAPLTGSPFTLFSLLGIAVLVGPVGKNAILLVAYTDTLRKQWDEIWETCLKDQGGNVPGKTIIFAMTKAHADRIGQARNQRCVYGCAGG